MEEYQPILFSDVYQTYPKKMSGTKYVSEEYAPSKDWENWSGTPNE